VGQLGDVTGLRKYGDHDMHRQRLESRRHSTCRLYMTTEEINGEISTAVRGRRAQTGRPLEIHKTEPRTSALSVPRELERPCVLYWALSPECEQTQVVRKGLPDHGPRQAWRSGGGRTCRKAPPFFH
jgi:hypothetical protein